MKKQSGFLISLLILFSLIPVMSCQDFFTTSPLASLRRDPSTLSRAQLEALAAAALEANDQETILEVYDLLTDDPPSAADDPATVLLIADLGIAGSGMTGLVAKILADPGMSVAEINALVAELDTAMLVMAITAILAVQAEIDAGTVPEGTISDSQYELAAIAILLVRAQSVGVENITALDPEVILAESLLDNSGSSTDLAAMVSILGISL